MTHYSKYIHYINIAVVVLILAYSAYMLPYGRANLIFSMPNAYIYGPFTYLSLVSVSPYNTNTLSNVLLFIPNFLFLSTLLLTCYTLVKRTSFTRVSLISLALSVVIFTAVIFGKILT